ncbi:hypothetical protein AAIR98_001448 [Elusimicrobium simillimum]|uniref:hypothetical protein n=1 Tax=Elusimicrobium simillimum TaxID=3143438 RepID=UPI003C7031D9
MTHIEFGGRQRSKEFLRRQEALAWVRSGFKVIMFRRDGKYILKADGSMEKVSEYCCGQTPERGSMWEF